jgi:hypothetical protein
VVNERSITGEPVAAKEEPKATAAAKPKTTVATPPMAAKPSNSAGTTRRA